MKKLTFEEVMNRYEDLVNDEYEFPSFSSLISARKLHPLGWRGIAASLLLIKHYFFL